MTITNLPLGALPSPAAVSSRTFRVGDVVTDDVPTPEEYDFELEVGNPPPPEPLRNGQLANAWSGCCTFSAADGLAARFQAAEAGAFYERMDPDELVQLYLEANGGDRLAGYYPERVLHQWRREGLPFFSPLDGQRYMRRIRWYGLANHRDRDEVMRALSVFRGLYVALAIPKAWDDIRFDPNAPSLLDVTDGPIAGYHAAPVNGGSRSGGLWLNLESWGLGRHLLTWPAVDQLVVEVWSVADDFDGIQHVADVERMASQLRKVD